MDKLGSIIAKARELRAPAQLQTPPLALREWECAVGSRIAARARPERLQRGMLWVRAATAAWATELSLLADVIVDRLKEQGLEVKGLRFSVGPVDGPKVGSLPEPPPEQAAPVAVPLPPELRRRIAEVGDSELRRALGKAATVSLSARPSDEGDER